MIKKLHYCLVLISFFLAGCSTEKMKAEKLLAPNTPLPSLQQLDKKFICHTEDETLWVPISETAQSLFDFAEDQFNDENISLLTKIEAYEAALLEYHPKALERILALYQQQNTTELLIQTEKLKISKNNRIDSDSNISSEVSNKSEDQALLNKPIEIDKKTKFNQSQPIDQLMFQSKPFKKNINEKTIDPNSFIYNEKILKTYQKMLEHQLPIGLTYMAILKKQGVILNKNVELSYRYLKTAAQMGNPRAQFMLGDYYFYTLGEYQEGLKAHRCALSNGIIDSYHALAIAKEVFEANYPQALEFHISAAEHGNLKSLTFLRSVFRDGLLGYDKDADLAKCFDQFIKIYSDMPNQIEGLAKSCPLPEHPELAFGEHKKEVAMEGVEEKFNPQRKYTTPQEAKPSKAKTEKSLKKMKAALMRLKANESRF